ncbi:MAG: alpha/beta hydrolase [Spirochaetia bacterium]|nr:alpha/beta hydrolase [Spirochaetia bacterium]
MEEGCTTFVRNYPVTCSDGHVVRCDIFQAPVGNEKHPALVFIHGGGFIGGDKDQFLWAASFLTLKLGITCVSVQYRTDAPYPAAVLDCVEVFGWLAGQSKELGIDEARICCVGGSPGANIMLLSMQEDWRKTHCTQVQKDMYVPTACIALNGIFFLPSFWKRNPEERKSLKQYFAASGQDLEILLQDASPLLRHCQGKRVLLLHGEEDEIVPLQDCKAMKDKLLADGNQAELSVFLHEPHAWFNAYAKQFSVLERMEEFIRQL